MRRTEHIILTDAIIKSGLGKKGRGFTYADRQQIGLRVIFWAKRVTFSIRARFKVGNRNTPRLITLGAWHPTKFNLKRARKIYTTILKNPNVEVATGKHHHYSGWEETNSDVVDYYLQRLGANNRR